MRNPGNIIQKENGTPKENREPVEITAETEIPFEEMDDDLPEVMSLNYVRPIECIREAEQEFFEKVWFIRNTKFVADENGHYILVPRHEAGSNFVETLLKKYGG